MNRLVFIPNDWKSNGAYLKSDKTLSINDYCRYSALVKALHYAEYNQFYLAQERGTVTAHNYDNNRTVTSIEVLDENNNVVDGIYDNLITAQTINFFLNKHKAILFTSDSPRGQIPRCNSQGLLSSIFNI